MPTAARTRTRKEWLIKEPNPQAGELSDKLGVPEVVTQVLVNREITNLEQAKTFLDPKLTELIPAEKTPGITEAVEQVAKAVQNKEKITIYGDYDVDGITGIAILWQLLRVLGANVDFYIPHRVDEGYGLNEEAVKQIAEDGTSLLITVDCGATAVDTAKFAKQLGMDMIITDHHQFHDTLPEAAAIVHPGIDPTYENQDAAGAMMAFKLAWAVANKFNKGRRLAPELRNFMINATSLAAMGTIADIVDLRGENRILTSYGLKTLPQSSLCGIQALIEKAGLKDKGLDSFDIGFRLAPMLNAAGRMGHARLAVELLTSDSEIRAAKIAEYLKSQNDQRRRCERKIFKQACELINQKGLNHPDRKSIVLADDGWHTGVIGIVASRIVEKFYRPTIMLNTANGIAQGSGRSIEGFDLLAAIKSCSDHLERFGGHKMAAGITIHPEKIEDFASALEEYTQSNSGKTRTCDYIEIDKLAQLEEFDSDTVRQLEKLEPFGMGNPEPVFATKGVRLAAPPRRVGSKGSHLQMTVTDNTSTVKCIGFRFGQMEKKLLETDFFNIAYRPQMNHYNGSSSVQLVISDITFEQ